jgi:hypothetical protein
LIFKTYAIGWTQTPPVMHNRPAAGSRERREMRHHHFFLAALALTLIGSTVPACAEQFVGLVKVVNGNTTIIRGAESIAALHGMEIVKGDIIETDRHGTIAIAFSDDTVISMGPKTRIAIDDYVFEPLEKRMSFVARIIHGTVSYLSGQIAKIAPESVQLALPAAIIGVRGTHVLIKVD